MTVFEHLLDLLHQKPGPISLVLMLKVTAVMFTFTVVRSMTIAGLAYLAIWKIWGDRLERRRILPERLDANQMSRELRWSFTTFAIYSLLGSCMYLLYRGGYTRYYANVADRGWAWFFFSIVLMTVLHDAYFYWTHRLLHLKWFYRHAHRVHHESRNPSPWAAFSFHPTEAAISFGIIPLVIVLIPYHVGAVAIFLAYMTATNVMGHLGYEIFPRGFAGNRVGGLYNTATHHAIHHNRVNWNYGLYSSVWDRIMGTNDNGYEALYDSIVSRTPSLPPPRSITSITPAA